MSPQTRDTREKQSSRAMDRREFLGTLAVIAGGTAATAARLSEIAGGDAAQVVPADDPRLETGYVKYPAAAGEMRAYFARPKSGGRLAGVVVIHENRGLRPHTEDIARRVALEGFQAIAPDALTPLGGTPADEDKARDLIGKLDREANVRNFVAAVAYLKTQPQATGKVACLGFCWGGGVTNQVAVNAPDLTAAVPFYGLPPAPADVPKIKATVLAHYAGEDERINAGLPAFEEALKKAGIDYRIYVYEDAQHAFLNDTSPRYNKEAAALAWQRTVAFLKDKLKA